jgi:WD repeat-containing protein 35
MLLLTQGTDGDDQLARDSCNQIGEHHADRFKWNKAAAYFKRARNTERVLDCYYRAGLYEEMRLMVPDLAEGTPIVIKAAKLFESVGMHEVKGPCTIYSSTAPFKVSQLARG